MTLGTFFDNLGLFYALLGAALAVLMAGARKQGKESK